MAIDSPIPMPILMQHNWLTHFPHDLLLALRGRSFALPHLCPWLIPMEQVGRKRDATVEHLHRGVNHWYELHATVQRWRAHCAPPSPA